MMLDTMATPRSNPLPGTLNPADIKNGKPRGRFGLYQRRAKPRVFGEPHFEEELTKKEVCEHQPHILAHAAWQQLVEAARSDGLDPTRLQIHSAYRSVALQHQIWNYRLAERKRNHPHLTDKQARQIQSKWTAIPGTSAHHTGLALDLKLYELKGHRPGATEEYRWLAHNARTFGFYPYYPEPWHWEYNPPGLVARIAELRRRLACGEPVGQLLTPPKEIPIAEPANHS